MGKIYVFIVFIFISSSLFSIDYITSPLISGIYEDVAIKNNTAYFVNEWGILIYDVTDKTDPVIIEIIPFTMAFYLGIQNDLLFVSNLVSSFGTYNNKTSIYDISNLYEPIQISAIEESANRFVVRDSLLFLQTQEFLGDELLYKLKIFDISDIYYPLQIAEIDSVKSFDFFDNYLYTVNTIYNETEIHLKIYNVEDIVNITLLNEISLPLTYTIYNDPYLLINENIIYIGEWNSLYILSIENSLLPDILSYTDCPELMNWINKFVKYNTYLYLNGGKIIDVSNPANPEIIGNYNPQWPPGNVITSLFINEDYLYVTNWEFGYYIMDLSNPIQPVQTYWYENIDYYTGIYKREDYAYVSSMQGVTILDVSAPEDSYVIGSYPYIQWSEDILIEDNFAYVACNYGLVVLNISNPENPYPVSDYQGSITRLAKKDNLIFAVENIWGIIRVYDVGNLSNIQYIGYYDFAENPNALSVKDNLLFIADANEHNYLINYNGGLRIIDISNPTNLQLIATINPDTTRYYRSVAVKDDYVFMGSNESGIYVFDVSNPMQPNQINYIESNRSSIDMEVQNEYLYNGVQIFDISDIFNIVLVDSCTSVSGGGVPWSIAVDGNYIYEASSYSVNIYYSSVIITEIDEEFNDNINSNKINLYQNYPNPFSTSTTIYFSLKTENTEDIEISIYNIKGQLVKQFKIQSPIKLGTKFKINQVAWEGKDDKGNELSSGIYFYKLSTQDKTFIKKMILMR